MARSPIYLTPHCCGAVLDGTIGTILSVTSGAIGKLIRCKFTALNLNGAVGAIGIQIKSLNITFGAVGNLEENRRTSYATNFLI